MKRTTNCLCSAGQRFSNKNQDKKETRENLEKIEEEIFEEDSLNVASSSSTTLTAIMHKSEQEKKNKKYTKIFFIISIAYLCLEWIKALIYGFIL